MLLYDVKNAQFTYEEDKKILYQKWIGFGKLEIFKEAIDELMKIARSHKVEYIISDTTESKVLVKEATDYAASVMPELFSLGMKKMAFVLPKNAFVEMTVNNFTKESNKKTSLDEKIKHFDSSKTAREWLTE